MYNIILVSGYNPVIRHLYTGDYNEEEDRATTTVMVVTVVPNIFWVPSIWYAWHSNSCTEYSAQLSYKMKKLRLI